MILIDTRTISILQSRNRIAKCIRFPFGLSAGGGVIPSPSDREKVTPRYIPVNGKSNVAFLFVRLLFARTVRRSAHVQSLPHERHHPRQRDLDFGANLLRTSRLMRYHLVPMLFGLTAACSSASNQPLPQIAAKLPADVRLAEQVFDRRVKAAYPVGSAESTVIAALQKSGFKIGPTGPDGYRSADIQRGDAICTTIWSVRWKADATSITDAFGVFGYRCP